MWFWSSRVTFRMGKQISRSKERFRNAEKHKQTMYGRSAFSNDQMNSPKQISYLASTGSRTSRLKSPRFSQPFIKVLWFRLHLSAPPSQKRKAERRIVRFRLLNSKLADHVEEDRFLTQEYMLEEYRRLQSGSQTEFTRPSPPSKTFSHFFLRVRLTLSTHILIINHFGE